ncbi:MAG: tRNA (N(6)-L-threonylcarbamoyladenosine(37)-C(2))-methylthiotransferase MtaB [Azospirillaceae bacterium]
MTADTARPATDDHARLAAAGEEGAATVVTFGCRLNAYESAVIRDHARAAGRGGDLVVVNTCAVTAEAERQARQAIRRLRRERPGAEIVVTGCAAQVAPERWAALAEADRVVGNEEKLAVATWRADGPAAPPVAVADIMAVRETASHLVDGFEGRARAFLQVQTGCDHRCTFCIIPYGRGNARSVPIGEIVARARALVAAGYAEIVLTGVDLTSYGGDLPGRPRLGQMLRRLLAQVPELPRLRLSSLDPVEIDEDLWRLIAGEARLMPHLHLSLQAGDDMILKRMKRRHSRADALAVAERARAARPGIALGADLIAGFPTETEAMFANTLALVEEAGLAHLHVFPYSEREGTPAARMPPVPKAERKVRAARLRAAGARVFDRFLDAQIGATARVVAETEGRGRTETYAPVRLTAPAPEGTLVAVRLTGREGDRLVAEPTG